MYVYHSDLSCYVSDCTVTICIYLPSEHTFYIAFHSNNLLLVSLVHLSMGYLLNLAILISPVSKNLLATWKACYPVNPGAVNSVNFQNFLAIL